MPNRSKSCQITDEISQLRDLAVKIFLKHGAGSLDDAISQAVEEAAERAVQEQRWTPYLIIPADDRKEVKEGVAMLPAELSLDAMTDIARVHVRDPLMRIDTFADNEHAGVMFVSLAPRLRRNSRADILLRQDQHLRSRIAVCPEFITGTAVVFDRPARTIASKKHRLVRTVRDTRS